MKTNVVMVRQMGNFKVEQRTKDGMFNATILLKQWNGANPGKSKEKVLLFFNNKRTKEFIDVLEEDLNGQKITHLNTKGKNGATWMHPYLFIKFAMWLNPKFELDVIKFVFDQLIQYRHLAGDNYKVLSAAGMRLQGYDFSKVAKAMQWIVFNRTDKDIRQTASPEQLKEIADIEQKLAFAIDMGYIKTFNHLMSTMRTMWTEKHNPVAA